MIPVYQKLLEVRERRFSRCAFWGACRQKQTTFGPLEEQRATTVWSCEFGVGGPCNRGRLCNKWRGRSGWKSICGSNPDHFLVLWRELVIKPDPPPLAGSGEGEATEVASLLLLRSCRDLPPPKEQLGLPVVPFLTPFFWGGFPYYNRPQQNNQVPLF